MGNRGARGGLESDAFTGWGAFFIGSAARLRKVKRTFGERMRRQTKASHRNAGE
jgi:hypothetical protein